MGGDGSAACPAKAIQSSRRQGAFTFTVCDVTAGGSGTASIEAATNPLNIKTAYEMDFISYYAHDSGYSVDQTAFSACYRPRGASAVRCFAFKRSNRIAADAVVKAHPVAWSYKYFSSTGASVFAPYRSDNATTRLIWSLVATPLPDDL